MHGSISPLAMATSPDSQPERLSQFFASGRKLSQVFGRSSSPNRPHGIPSVRTFGYDTSASFKSNRPGAPSISPTTLSSNPKKAKKRQSVSPLMVSSIVSSMYAYPVNTHDSRLPPQSWNGDQISGPSRTTSLTAETTAISRASGGSHSLSSRSRKSSKAVERNTTPALRSPSMSVPTASGSSRDRKESFHSLITKGLLNEQKPPPTNSSDSSALRVVGRGGSGSRPRAVAPKPVTPHPPPRQEPPVFYRPNGRGGLGSRQKPISSTPPVLNLIHLKKIALKGYSKQKGKGRVQPTFIHPIPPHLSSQITNESSSTISTIHFAGEAGGRPPNLFPTDSSLSTVDSDVQFADIPPFCSTSSTFERISSPVRSTYDGNSDLDLSYHDDSRSSMPDDHRKGNLNKLARTLGDFPAGTLYEALMVDQPLTKGRLPKLIIQDAEPKKPNTKKFRRASLNLSISGFGSIFNRPSCVPRDSAASYNTVSTQTNDLHQLDMGDQLSESWGEIDSSSTFRSESPITFSPPSPVLGAKGASPFAIVKVPSSLSMLPLETDHDSQTTSTTADEALSISSPTTSLSRPHSYYNSRRRSVRVSGHAYSASTAFLTGDNALEPPPRTSGTTATASGSHVMHSAKVAKANWLIPPSPVDDEETSFAMRGDIPENPQAWTGEWNNDMQDVIKALRQL